MQRIFIDGREGTTGLRIEERLQKYDDIALLTLPESERKDAGKRKEMLHSADIVFLCLPDAAAREAAALAAGSHARIIDASTAHRTHAGWIYGLPELGGAQYAAIKDSARIAVPGCHASGFIALTYPLLQAGVLPPDALLSCTSLTGYSGGGKAMIASYRDDNRPSEYDAPRHYALSQAHKHLSEMQAVTGLEHPPVFSPVIADFYAGMIVSIPLHAATFKKKAGAKDIRELYAAHYALRPLISVLPYPYAESFYAANAFAGRDSMELLVAGNDERMCVMARYDNLGKGASGAAVQCMNIMLGKEEAAHLTV